MLREEKYSGSLKPISSFPPMVDKVLFFLRGGGMCLYWNTKGLKRFGPDLCAYIIV